MAMQILSDLEHEASVIIDDETGRAYGYVTRGPGHAEVQRAFMDGLQTHIGAYEPYELSKLWDGFNTALESVLDERKSAEDTATATEAGGPPEATPGPAAADSPSASAAGAQEPAAQPTDADAVDPTSAGSSQTLPSSQTTSTPSAGALTMQCFNCGGTGREKITQAECGVCGGTGTITQSPKSSGGE